MSASAVFMAVLGLAGTFLPQEVQAWCGAPPNALLVLVIQLAGALYVSFAILDWMAKESLIGGIYNRPLALGNLLHFTMGALALVKGASVNRGTPALMILGACYALFAIAFGSILVTSPVKPQ